MPKPPILLKNITIHQGLSQPEPNGHNKKTDIYIDRGIIYDIKPQIEPTKEAVVHDLSGCIVCPGFIDMHTHLRDFQEGTSEDISSGTKAAAAGGYTTVVSMANTHPPIDNPNILGNLKEFIDTKACIKVLPVAAVTVGLKGEKLTDIFSLAERGAIAFSDDGQPVSNLGLLRRALEYVQLTGRFIISHAEDKDLSANGSMNESARASELGLKGIPNAAQAASIAREIEVLRLTGGHIHFAHLGSAASVNLIRRAKEDGLSVSCDVTPHHICLTDNDVQDYNSVYKMNPPLASANDQVALVEALKDGTIDAIATDHAPHAAHLKNKTFDQCAFGVIGLETAFSLIHQTLVKSGIISFARLIELISYNPARLLGLPCLQIKSKQVANLAIIDPAKKWLYSTNNGFSKSHNSPFNGQELLGKNIMTLYQGEIVYQSN